MALEAHRVSGPLPTGTDLPLGINCGDGICKVSSFHFAMVELQYLN
jgi:hypothetical protein